MQLKVGNWTLTRVSSAMKNEIHGIINESDDSALQASSHNSEFCHIYHSRTSTPGKKKNKFDANKDIKSLIIEKGLKVEFDTCCFPLSLLKAYLEAVDHEQRKTSVCTWKEHVCNTNE